MKESAGLGALLRERREGKGVSLADLSRATRIVPRMLTALEEDRLRDLPAPVFVRGFIRAYCQAVAEPPDEALARYEAWVEAIREQAAALAVAPPAARRRGFAVSRSVGTRLVLVGLLIVAGGLAYLLASSAATSPGAPTGVRPEATPPAPAAAAPRPEQAAKPRSEPAAAATPAHVLVVRAHEETWISVQPEAGAVSQELLEPGSVREWRSSGRFTVTVGNAGGLTLELNGVALPSLGNRGEVVRDLQLPKNGTP